MNDKDLQDLWNSPSPNDPFIIQQEKLIQQMKTRMKKFDKDIKRRNIREYTTAVIVFIAFTFFGVIAFYQNNYLLTLACTIISLGCVFIVYKLFTAQVHISAKAVYTMSNKDYLYYELEKVNEQIKLLKSVFWWYLLPILIGCILFFVASTFTTKALCMHIIFALIITYAIYYANQRTLETDLVPLKKDLEEQLANLE